METELQVTPGRGQSDSASAGLLSEPTAINLAAPPEPLQRKDELGQVIARIKAHVAKVREAQVAVFQIGELLNQAKKEWPDDYGRIVREAGLRSTSNADNYRRVADAAHLRKQQYRDHLPVGVGALIDLVKWKDHEIKECIDAGVLHPDATRKDLADWKKSRHGTGQDKGQGVLLLQVYVYPAFVPDWSEADTLAIQQALERYPDNDDEKPVLKVVTKLLPAQKHAEAMGRWAAEVQQYIIKGARKKVRDARRAFKKLHGRDWSRTADELDILDDADEMHVRNVLEEIGWPEYYNVLRDDAYATIKQPEPPR